MITTSHTKPVVYDTNLSAKYSALHANSFELPLLRVMLENKRALDIGCGSGRLLIPLQAEGFNVHGLEGSQAMYDSCTSKGGEAVTHANATSDEFFDLMEDLEPDLVYLSFSLHQIHPTIDAQLGYLKKLLDYCDVLLITTLPEYFGVNPTTRFSEEATNIDLLRFPSRDWFLSNFNVAYSVDLLVHSPSISRQFVDGLDSKHISTFQLTDTGEAARVRDLACAEPYLPQVHSYILLEKQGPKHEYRDGHS